jgi:1-acyl-sn-glycerol-3-phosphate acyltransferase
MVPYLLTSLFIFGPISIINLFSKKYGFYIKNMYMSSLSFFIKYFMGLEIYTNSNTILEEFTREKSKHNILISNHPTEIDFMIFPFIVNNIRNFLKYKYISIAKKTIGYILIGISMSSILSKDLFLDRDIEHDKERLSKNNNCNLLFLFPEGTCFTSAFKKKSDVYTKKNKLINFNYHLYPRITGLEIILKNHKFKNLYDMTIVYDTIPKEWYGTSFNLLGFINKFKFPSRVFINFDKYDIEKNKDDLQNFLETVYKNKDKFISNFDSNSNKFKRMDYNYYNGMISFIYFIILFFMSSYVFLYYNWVSTFYLIEIIIYFIYLAFVY